MFICVSSCSPLWANHLFNVQLPGDKRHREHLNEACMNYFWSLEAEVEVAFGHVDGRLHICVLERT